MTQRFEGKSLDEALEAAGSSLGVERYQLTYRVLTEKRGFLGGVKNVVVEAEVNTSSPPVHEQTSFQIGSETPRRPRERSSRSEGQRGGGSRDRSARGQRPSRDRGRAPAADRERNDYVIDSNEIVEAPPQAEQSTAAKEVTDWFAEVIRLGRLELETRSSETDEEVNVSFYGHDARKLFERNGELLDALQVLANKTFGRREGAKSIECDAGNYKEVRSTELEERARRVADQVRRDGREQTLPAMSPIERRIIHLALAEDADVTTESRGEGFFKRVSIVPRENLSARPSES